MGKKIWLSMHPRNFGSHMTVRPSVRPPAPQSNQRKMIFFSFCSTLMIDVYVKVN